MRCVSFLVTLGIVSVSAITTGFLIIPFDVLCHGKMNDKSNVRFVNSHTITMIIYGVNQVTEEHALSFVPITYAIVAQTTLIFPGRNMAAVESHRIVLRVGIH